MLWKHEQVGCQRWELMTSWLMFYNSSWGDMNNLLFTLDWAPTTAQKWFHPTLGSESVCLLGFSAGVPWVMTHKSCIPGALYPICSQRYWRESLPINFHCFYNSEERPAELVVMASESCEFPLTAQHLNLWPALTLFLPSFHHVSWVMERVIIMPDYFLSFMAELLGHSSTLNVLEVWPVRILCCKY